MFVTTKVTIKGNIVSIGAGSRQGLHCKLGALSQLFLTESHVRKLQITSKNAGTINHCYNYVRITAEVGQIHMKHLTNGNSSH